MMRGVYFEKHGKVKEVLKLGDIPKPLETELAPGELLIQVFAGALNPADYKSTEGEQKLLLNFHWPRQYGFDFSGIVIAINSHDTFQPNYTGTKSKLDKIAVAAAGKSVQCILMSLTSDPSMKPTSLLIVEVWPEGFSSITMEYPLLLPIGVWNVNIPGLEMISFSDALFALRSINQTTIFPDIPSTFACIL